MREFPSLSSIETLSIAHDSPKHTRFERSYKNTYSINTQKLEPSLEPS
ncbi:hypothetical protein AYI70_g11967, partial [Smittium culicis]